MNYVADEFESHVYKNSTIESTSSMDISNEVTNEKIIENPVTLINEQFWYSKPIVSSIITHQIFFQLSTENNGTVKKKIDFLYLLDFYKIKFL